MDKWPGGQNGGNHCHRTEYRKKSEKKWIQPKRPLGSIHIIGVPEGGEREKGPEKIFEKIIAENFPNMGKEIVNQVQEAQRDPGRMNTMRNTPRHIVIKLTKIKDKILKATREKGQVTYQGTPIRLSANFSTETLQARGECHDIFKVIRQKNLQPILYPERLLFRFDGKIKSFTDKQKLREFSTTEPTLQQF